MVNVVNINLFERGGFINNISDLNKRKTIVTNIDEYRGILVYVEHQNGAIDSITYELIGKAIELAKPLSYKVYCLYIGYNIKEKAEVFNQYEVEKVYVYDSKDFKDFKADIFANVFEDCIYHLKPSIVLIGGTDIGKSVAPVVATRFHTGITADCTELKVRENSELIQIRPAFGGNVMAQIVTKNRPQFATVRRNVMVESEKQEKYKDNIMESIIDFEKLKSKIEVIRIDKVKHTNNIFNAKILVVVGQGFKSKEDIEMAKELAELLNAPIASSRALVEKGWMSYERQVGLSGITVKPEIIITLGVSGSIQFLAGMKFSKKIIAINIDKDSPIFTIAHHPINGDIYEVLPKLIEQVKLIKTNHHIN